jgi:uncharacterized protein YecE (DUF72 family)
MGVLEDFLAGLPEGVRYAVEVRHRSWLASDLPKMLRERGGIRQFFERAETRQTPTSILGTLVFWFVFVIAIVMATDALGIRQVSVVLTSI